MTTDIRVLDSEGDLVAAANVFRAAMIGFPRVAGLEAEQISRLLESGRTIGAFVGDELVGTADAQTSTLTLPGGAIVGHAAVTHIGVLPSFTRQGIATDLVRHQLRDVAARGEPVATLRASEATIYERYGYGAATRSHTVEVQTARAALRPGVAGGGPVRLLDPAQVWDVLPRIYAENRPSRPGTIDRPDMWWHSIRLRTESSPGPWYVAAHGTAGAETGFARYRPIDTDKWFVSDARTIVVEDFFAPDLESYVGLLRFLLGLDLIDRVVFFMLPVDDPMPWLLLDQRAVKVTNTHDETWLRIVDVEKSLTARCYADGPPVTIAVDDTLLPDNCMTVSITADGAERVDRQPQLRVGVAGLAAVMLGGATWHSLSIAGLAHADEPSHLAAADRLFAVQQAPHAGFFF